MGLGALVSRDLLQGSGCPGAGMQRDLFRGVCQELECPGIFFREVGVLALGCSGTFFRGVGVLALACKGTFSGRVGQELGCPGIISGEWVSWRWRAKGTFQGVGLGALVSRDLFQGVGGEWVSWR